MKLEGSCHCRKVRFTVQSREPVPYQRCYCSICRKTGGGGGYLINLGGQAGTLAVTGKDHVKTYRAPGSKHERHFCGECGSHLWAFHPDWPDLVHPVAGAIDTELPMAPSLTHMMLGSRAGWVPFRPAAGDATFDEYPDTSLASWHEKRGLTSP